MSPAPGAYPVGDITFISAAPPGGGWHTVCVKAAEALATERLVPARIDIVTNPGGLKVFEDVITTRRGDGHTLVAFSPGLTMQILLKGSQYSYADITPIASLSTDYGALVVPAGSEIADLGVLLARLRRDPTSLAITGGSGPGAMHHGMIGAVASAAGVPPKDISYLGAGGVAQGIADLKAGTVPLGALGAADVLGEVRHGTLRILAILSDRRLPAPLDGVPTAREQGLDVVFPMWRGFFGPPAMPQDAVAFWSETFTRLSRTDTWAGLLQESNWFPFLLVGDAFRTFLDADTRRYTEVLRGR